MFYTSTLINIVKLLPLRRFRYRDRASIIMDILDTVKHEPRGKTKTSIMRGANLNLDQVNKYLDVLMVCDFLRAEDPLESHEVARYRLTQKGLKLVMELEALHYALRLLFEQNI